MAKIERILGSIFSGSAVKQKESPDNKNQQEKNQNSSGSEEKQEKPDDSAVYSKETLEKSIKEFSAPDIRVELLETKDGFKVKLIHLPDSSVVRILSPSEFMKLKESSTADKKARGKILDQRF